MRKQPADGARGDERLGRIDISSDRELDKWSRRLDVTHDQLREAVRAVGSLAADIEWHLKGPRATAYRARVPKARTTA